MSKLTDYPAVATLPSQDVGRARKFYEDKLGFKVAKEDAGGVTFESAGTRFYLFESMGKPSGDHTQMNFEVDNLDVVMSEMREAGVTFETYDMGDFKTDENGVLAMPDGAGRAAWFKDTEGNLIALSEGM